MRKLDHQSAIVLFSGGQDSSICLAWALEQYSSVYTIGFDYGQRHAIELGARQKVRRELVVAFPEWRNRLKADQMVSATGLREITDSAMTSETEITTGDNGLPTTFVPGRNLLFLVLASGLAYRLGAGVLVAGMCETDYSGYPDCRETTLSTQMEAIRLGSECDMRLETPLMHETKAASWAMAEKIGGSKLVDLINEHSHTCYRGTRVTRHEWGYGCGECPACELRAKGWLDYRASA